MRSQAKAQGARALALTGALPPLAAPLEIAWVERLLWPAVVAVAALASIAPLWSSALLPFQDAPQHLASIRVLADYHAPGYGFEKWFTIDLLRLQYLGFYLPAAALAKFFGPDAACRILLSLLALATPAAFWMLLGALGRDRRLAVFAPAIFHTGPLYLGFFNFLESIPVALVVVALVERQLREPALRRGAILALLAAALLWLHPSALAWVLGASFILWVTAPKRRFLPVWGAFAPAVALLLAWAAQALASRDGVGQVARAPPRWHTLHDQVLELLRYGNVLAGHADELCVTALGLLWLALVVLRGKAPQARWWRVPLIAALTLVAYLASPYDMGFMGYIHTRAMPFLALMTVASVRVPARPASSAILGAVAAVTLLGCIQVARTWRAFDAEAEVGALQQVLRAAEPGQSLTAVMYTLGSHEVQYQSYMHFGAYYELWRGGRARYNFAETPWTPVRYRAETAPPPLPRGWELAPEKFDPLRDTAGDRYLLLHGPGPDPGPVFTLRTAAGQWKLYEATRR